MQAVSRGDAADEMTGAHVDEDGASSDANTCEPAFESRNIIHLQATMPDVLTKRL